MQSSDDIYELVDSIADGQPASAVVYDTSGNEHKHECVFKVSEPPCFFLLFPSGALPTDLDQNRQCIFTGLDVKGRLLTFGGNILNYTNNRILELEGTKPFKPEELREYFRVDLRVPVKIVHQPTGETDLAGGWESEGETIDISQSGVLVMLSDECRSKREIRIEIQLNNPAKTVVLLGHMVRKNRVKKNRWLTSFQFDEISPADRDAIAMNCFAAQRKQLRENVKISS